MRHLFILGSVIALAACAAPEGRGAGSADKLEAERTAKLQQEAVAQTGLPNITSFTEKKFAKLIYELRDSEITTYSYFMDYTGSLHFLCESIGYGLPFSVQYVNPEKTWVRGDAYYDVGGTIPQPEPNGLFMPDGLSATWVLCSDGEGSVRPIYSEPSLIVSPFKLNAATALRTE